MNPFLLLTPILILLSTSACATGWDQTILSVNGNRPMVLEELASELSSARTIVLGEKHNTPSVQKAQSRVMEAVIGLDPRQPFTTAWEFLDYSDQSKIDSAFQRYSLGEISANDFLIATQGHAKNSSYLPILEVTRQFKGRLIGVNLSRADKEPVVQGGIAHAKPGTVPDQFERGSAGYFERFKKSMEGHTPEAKLMNYYEAQCLTDDVMADQLLKDHSSIRRFLVVGSFHSDYYDGTVARLMKRAPDQGVKVVRFVDASDYTEAELQALAQDVNYGPIADFIYFVNEPNSP